jgi:hypothetical protein
MEAARRLGVRWTIGDVSERGYEALRLSIWGAWKVFGPDAAYAVCVNTMPLARARERTGPLPEGVIWHDATNEIPAFLRPHLEAGMAEGVAWKFAPLQFFPDRFELSLDNDCILWDAPAAIRQWLVAADPQTCVVAEDVVACFGQFAALCGPEPRNGGIRGLPPGFDYEAALTAVLREHPVLMTSELDEQGLQTATLRRFLKPLVVTVEEVTICSPFPPHLPYLGRCGAHFCGLNARSLPWSLAGRPATDYIEENWQRLKAEVSRRVAPPAGAGLTSRGTRVAGTSTDGRKEPQVTP